MNIPDKATYAAQEFAYHELNVSIPAVDVRQILEAAAPFIAAQALRDAEDAAYNTDDGSFVDVYRAEIAEWLTARADDLEAGK